MFSFTRLSLARQYLLFSLLVMAAGMVVIGVWVSRLIETAVTNRTAAVTALYVDSFLSPYLQTLATNDELTAEERGRLEWLLTGTALGQQVVSFKIWTPDGRVVYSPNPDLIGQQFPIEGGLAQALNGEVISEVSDLDKEEQSFERVNFDRLIETYAPTRAAGSGNIIAVSEFYQTADGLEAEIRAAQIQSWLLVVAVMTAVYLLLASLVGRASHLILTQQTRLQASVDQLQELLVQNQQLHQRVQRAAVRTTEINEQYLRRISADLHDGPAQDLALALLRIDALTDEVVNTMPAAARDFHTVQKAINAAMTDLRTISAGLRLPEINDLSLTDTIKRTVYEYEQKTRQEVVLTTSDMPENAPLPIKITIYRIVQEALSNSFRHANGRGQSVHMFVQDGWLVVEVADTGPGFQTADGGNNGRLGLIGMRERIEILGGHFEIISRLHQGTLIRAQLPLAIPEDDHV